MALTITPGETDAGRKTVYFAVFDDVGRIASGEAGGIAAGWAVSAITLSSGDLQVEHERDGYAACLGTFGHNGKGEYYYIFSNSEVGIGLAPGTIALKFARAGFRTSVTRVQFNTRSIPGVEPGELDANLRTVYFPVFDNDGMIASGEGTTWSVASIALVSGDMQYEHERDGYTAIGGTFGYHGFGEYYYIFSPAEVVGSLSIGTIAMKFERSGYRTLVDRVEFSFGGSPKDVDPPTISIVSPTPGISPGDPGGFSSNPNIAMNTPIVLDVTDVDPGTQYVAVFVKFLQIPNHIEVVYRGGVFVGLYAADSSSSVITDGIRLTVQRTGGWVLDRTLVSSIEFQVDALDQDGNLQ